MKYPVGSPVEYSYRKHYLLGGDTVFGTGRIISQTVIGNNDGYVIKPDDGSECVHVRESGVSIREYCTDYHCAGDCNELH